MKEQKKSNRKSVISMGLIILVGIFVFLLIIFVCVKLDIINLNDVIKVETKEKQENATDGDILGVSNIVNVSSYVFNAKKEGNTTGYFTNLTNSSNKQSYVSLVLEEDKLLGFNASTLNKFIITVFDTEILETFTGIYEKDGDNIVLKFMTNMYNNYELPKDIKIFLDQDQAILDGNKLTKVENITKAYSNDTLSALPGVFGTSNINFASVLFVKDDLSDFGVASQTKFLITGFNVDNWDFYVGEAYENDAVIDLKMKNYGLNDLNDIMPKEAKASINSEGIVIDNIQFKETIKSK